MKHEIGGASTAFILFSVLSRFVPVALFMTEERGYFGGHESICESPRRDLHSKRIREIAWDTFREEGDTTFVIQRD